MANRGYQVGEPVEVPFKDFAPDLPLNTPGILLDTQGVFPTVKGYQLLNQAAPLVYGALAKAPVGATVGTYSDGSSQYWAGTTDHLYRRQGIENDPASVWVLADSLGGGNTFGATKWRFAQFNDDLIAVGGKGVAAQVATGSADTFSNLGGAPPANASIVVAVNSQVMMFATNKWYVSAINGDNTWVTETNNQGGTGTQIQSGFAPITDLPGNIVAAQAIFRNVVVFKNQGIWFGSYIGGDSIWSFPFIDDTNGTWCQEATMLIPGGIAFLGLDDFYTMTGYTPQRISNNLKEWFFDTADPAFLTSVTSRYDVTHAVGTWHFVSHNPPFAGVPDRYVSYNFRAQRWATGYLSTPCVPIPNYHFGTTANISGSYFDTNNVLQSFRGAPGTGRLLTGYLGLSGKMSQLMRVRVNYGYFPQSEVVAPFHVNVLGRADVVGPAAVKGFDDWHNLRQTDRYHRVQVQMTGSTTTSIPPNVAVGAEAAGISVEWGEAGDR